MLRISSFTKEGIPELWKEMIHFKTSVQQVGEFLRKREHQHKVWMWNFVRDHIMELFTRHSSVREAIPTTERRVAEGELTPGQGADILLQKFVKDL